MRRLGLIFFLLLLATPLLAQNQTFPTSSTTGNGFVVTTATMTGGAISLLNSDVHYHTLTWYVVGPTPSGCTVILEGSSSGTTGWTSVIGAQACTATGETTTSTAADVNYVRIRATSFTGATTSVFVVYKGYVANPYGSIAGGGGGGGGAATIADGADVAEGHTTDPANSNAGSGAATMIGISKEISGILQAALVGTKVAVANFASDGVTPISAITDPCYGQTGTQVTTSIASSGSTVIIPGVASKKTYVCFFKANSSDAAGEIVSTIEGTGTAMATSRLVIDGSTTAANGNMLAASGGGYVASNGGNTVYQTTVTSNDFGILNSGSHRVIIFARYVQQYYEQENAWLSMLQ